MGLALAWLVYEPPGVRCTHRKRMAAELLKLIDEGAPANNKA